MAGQPRYHINVFWYPGEQCWVADVPDLRPCSANAETPELAIAALRGVIDSWLEAAQSAELPVPEPCYCPSLYAARQ